MSNTSPHPNRPQENHEIISISQFPRELRLFVNNICNHDCKYGSGIAFCHSKDDKQIPHQLGVKQAEIILDTFSRWDFDTLRICGMEPTLNRNLDEIVIMAKDMGFSTVKITTNGTRLSSCIDSLIDNGLNGITVSLHSLNPTRFHAITGGILEPILKGLETVKDYQIPTKVNCVVQKGVNEDIKPILDYSWNRGFIPKIYQLIWQPSTESNYNLYFKSISEILSPYLPEMSCISETRFRIAKRTRYRYRNNQDNLLEFGTFSPKFTSPLEGCRKCIFSLKCDEGFMGYGFEVSSDFDIHPCYIRNEASFSLKPFLNKEYHELIGRILKTNSMLGGGSN
ncbi:MAG: radical SAM protein [Candidatus Thorarchaeota archaeon]